MLSSLQSIFLQNHHYLVIDFNIDSLIDDFNCNFYLIVLSF